MSKKVLTIAVLAGSDGYRDELLLLTPLKSLNAISVLEAPSFPITARTTLWGKSSSPVISPRVPHEPLKSITLHQTGSRCLAQSGTHDNTCPHLWCNTLTYTHTLYTMVKFQQFYLQKWYIRLLLYELIVLSSLHSNKPQCCIINQNQCRHPLKRPGPDCGS